MRKNHLHLTYQKASRQKTSLMGILLVLGVFSGLNSSAQDSFTAHGFPDSAYTSTPSFGFFDLSALNDTIDPFNLSIQLLSAAIHYTTNEQRKEHGLRPLAFYPPLRNMAQQHSNAMTRFGFIDHINPYQSAYKTVPLRSKRFKANAVSENVASSFLHCYDDGDTYYRVWNSGKGHYEFFTSEGAKIRRNTYLSFARQVVKSWMESRGHRKAILRPEHTSLGCAVQLRVADMQKGVLPLIYCTQNFGAGGEKAIH
ncbi:MAG: CAP domain-containing protein [Bacteroidota bacterium]